MKLSPPTTRGLVIRILLIVVWGALLAVSIASGDSLRITISAIGLAATVATVILWWVQKRRTAVGDDPADEL